MEKRSKLWNSFVKKSTIPCATSALKFVAIECAVCSIKFRNKVTIYFSFHKDYFLLFIFYSFKLPENDPTHYPIPGPLPGYPGTRFWHNITAGLKSALHG